MKHKYLGWEFRPALTAAIHKMASDLGLSNVRVYFKESIPTAAINRQGDIMINNIADDAVLTAAQLEQFTGFAYHELLHWKYTTFSDMNWDVVEYQRHLHNALEDAFIENKAIANKLTGNAEPLLSNLIDRMATQAIDEVTDWAHPKQYPFALAVYARKHSTIKVPLANGLQPLFDEACSRLNGCTSTAHTWALAEWLFKELCALQPNEPPTNPKPPTNPQPPTGGDGPTGGSKPPTSPDQGDDEGEGKGKGDKPVGDAKSPIKGTKVHKGQTVRTIYKPRSTEPMPDMTNIKGSGGNISDFTVTKEQHHVGDTPKWKINF